MSTIPARVPAVLILAALLAAPATARAEGIGVGMFVGEPTGITIKVDLQRRTALDIVLGVMSIRRDDRNDGYAHLTYQVTPFAAKGRSVVVPFRIGLGVAVFGGAGDFGDEINVAARAPLGIALQLRKTPLEFYGEITFKLVFFDDQGRDDDVFDVDGGIGFRLYF